LDWQHNIDRKLKSFNQSVNTTACSGKNSSSTKIKNANYYPADLGASKVVLKIVV